MTTITEVRFAHDRGALAETLLEAPDVDVVVVRERSTNPDRNLYVMRFDCDDSDGVRTLLERDSTVSSATSMPGLDDQNLWGIEFAPETKLLAPRVTSAGGFVMDARSVQLRSGVRGWHERWLVPDRKAVHDIWQGARDDGFEFEVMDLRERDRVDTEHPARGAITERQQEALTAAYEQGYFSEPRAASLEDLAHSLDQSPSAVGGRLKRGLKALIEQTLVVTEEDDQLAKTGSQRK